MSFEGFKWFFAVHFFGGVELIILTAVAYDCYVVICNSFYYSSIINLKLCDSLIGVSWRGGFFHSIVQILFIF
jgi:olfactory receptor